MTRRWIVLVWMFVSVLLTTAALVLAAPPRVVSAQPDNGQTDVDPATRQIKIVFDQPMSRDGFSVVGGGPNFPQITARPRWVDDRTLVIGVSLREDHEYWLSINSDRFTNFRNPAGEPAVAYAIAFTTIGAKGATTLPAEVNRESIAQLRRAMDQEYSYRDLRGVDWDKQFAAHADRLQAAPSAAAFAREAAAMLAPARDMHLVLQVGQVVYPTHRPGAGVNFDPTTLRRVVPGLKGTNPVLAGRFPDGIVYVLITTWAPRNPAEMERAYAALGDAAEGGGAKGVIIDVRPNSGGDEQLAQHFAGCFIDRPRVYSKNTIRKGGEWLGPYDRVVEPATAAARPRVRAPVVVLMGPQNMSSAESFLLMMRQVSGCKLVGAPSYGSSGNPKPHELANGVSVLLPSWHDMFPDGTCLEGVGVRPDVEVRADPATLRERDPVLDEALKILRGPGAKGGAR